MDPESSSSENPIRLDQFLKLAGVVATGGHAKLLIQQGEVLLNGAVETRRRRKLAPGDVIEVGDEVFAVADPEADD